MYAEQVARVTETEGYILVDAVEMTPSDDPEWPATAGQARQKFLAEHTHDDDEDRFFARGAGVFYLHVGGAGVRGAVRGGRPAERARRTPPTGSTWAPARTTCRSGSSTTTTAGSATSPAARSPRCSRRYDTLMAGHRES